MRKRVATKDFVRRLRGSVSQNLILHLVRISFGPGSDLVRTSLKLQPVKTQPGEVLERLCNGLPLGLLLLLLLLLLSLLVLLLLSKAWFFGQRNQKHQKMT